MLHLLRLHSGWISYVSNENLKTLFGIHREEIYHEPITKISRLPANNSTAIYLDGTGASVASFRSFRTRDSVGTIRSNDDVLGEEEEEGEARKSFAQENSKKSIYYKLLCPNTRSIVKDRLTHDQEIESPAYWRLQYKKELFQWIQETTAMLLDELTGMDMIGTDEDRRVEIMKYIDIEYEARIALLSHFDDEMYEAMHIRDNQKELEESEIPANRKLADHVRNTYSRYINNQILLPTASSTASHPPPPPSLFYSPSSSSPPSSLPLFPIYPKLINESSTSIAESRKILDIMNWRSFELIGEVGSVLWNLILGMRLLIRIRQGVLKHRDPTLSLEDIVYFMYLVDEHRLGSYFPTCFNGYQLGSQGMHINNGVYIYLRDVLLDELGLYMYNTEMLDAWENGDKEKMMSSAKDNGVKDRRGVSERWNMFMNTHVGHLGKSDVQMDGEVVVDDEEDEEELEIDVYGPENEEEVKNKYAHVNEHKRYKKVPSRIVVNGNQCKVVLKTPPEGNSSKISKRIETHENLLVKYNIRKIKETMLLMQEEHNMEMRLRKVKGAYQIPDKTIKNTEDDNLAVVFKTKHIKVHDNLYDEEDGEEGYDVSDDLINYFNNMGLKKINMQTSIQNIIQDFPVPEVMRNFMENKERGISDAMNLKLSDSAAFLRDFCINGLKYDESNDDFDESRQKKVKMDENHQKVYEEFVSKVSKRDILKECSYIGLNMLTYHNIQYTYLEKYQHISVQKWSKIQTSLQYFFLVNGVRANETQLVIDAHEWIALYLKNRPWKRETYKRSGIAKPSSLGIESWRFAEAEYTIRNFTHENLFAPLLPLLETHYPNTNYTELLKSGQGKRPILEHLYLGTYLMGYYHTILKTMSDKEINNIKIGIFLDPRIYHPYQNDIVAYLAYWWLQQQLRQSDVDINRSVFYWELESKYYNIYRGELTNPVITRVGGDWCVFDGVNHPDYPGVKCKWTRPGTNTLHLVNCGDNMCRAMYVWMKLMDRANWLLEQRDPSLRVWNEFIPLDGKDKSNDHRKSGKIVNLMGTAVYETYIINRDTVENEL